MTKPNWKHVPEVVRLPLESTKAILDRWSAAAREIIECGMGIMPADVKAIAKEIGDAKEIRSLATSALATLAKANK